MELKTVWGGVVLPRIPSAARCAPWKCFWPRVILGVEGGHAEQASEWRGRTLRKSSGSLSTAFRHVHVV